VYGYGSEGEYNIMVMEVLGKSIEKIFKECDKKFSIPTGYFLAIQMVFLEVSRIIKDFTS